MDAKVDLKAGLQMTIEYSDKVLSETVAQPVRARIQPNAVLLSELRIAVAKTAKTTQEKGMHGEIDQSVYENDENSRCPRRLLRTRTLPASSNPSQSASDVTFGSPLKPIVVRGVDKNTYILFGELRGSPPSTFPSHSPAKGWL